MKNGKDNSSGAIDLYVVESRTWWMQFGTCCLKNNHQRAKKEVVGCSW